LISDTTCRASAIGSTELNPHIICIALLAAGLSPQQDPPPAPPAPTPQRSDRKARGQQDQETKVEKEPSERQQQTDTPADGPALLSRDRSLISKRSGKLLDIRFYGEIMGIYDSGLTPVTVNTQGNIVDLGADYGTEAGFGLNASRRWKHSRIDLEYKGKQRYYTNNTFFNGGDHFVNLVYGHLLRQHLTLDVKETAGTTTLANGEFSYLPLTNTDLFALPANELFDNRTNYAKSRIDLLWQKSPRLSFGWGGEGFLVRRESLALAGLNGYTVRADVAYRLTRRQTIAGSYKYTYYDFQRAFGDTTLQTVTLGYAIALNRRLDLSVQIGGSRVDSLGLTQVSLDPAVAAIVGQSVAVVSFARTIYVPLFEARLIQRFDRSSFTVGYSSGVTPGNGVYLTSRQSGGAATYSYTGYRRLTAALTASYNQLSALGQTLGKYTNLQGGGGITYQLVRDTHLEVRYDYRHYTTQNAFFQKDSNRVSVGLAYSPGEKPLAIW
jgi:hypothetical protein